jgi:predicted dehydrogenase
MQASPRVLIVGCGRIAGGFDLARPSSLPPLTHAGAYRAHGGFAFAACVDPDRAQRDAFLQRFRVPQGFDTVPQAAAAGPFDVVSICSPTAWHAQHVDEALALKPRLVFCEKPLAPTRADSESMVRACAEAGVLLAVNHTRRWAPDVWKLADELALGEWGLLRSISGTYNKGLLNNGSHLIDLLHRLLPEHELPLRVHAAGEPLVDHDEADPTLPALLATAGGVPVQLGIAWAADYALFELTLVTSKAVITMEDGGQRWRVRRAAPSAHFAGYRSLEPGEARPGRYSEAALLAVSNLHDTLCHGAPLLSTGQTALQAQAVVERIRQRALIQGRHGPPARRAAEAAAADADAAPHATES